MTGCLQINDQQWPLWGELGMNLFWPRQHADGSIFFCANWLFAPPGVDPATVSAETPKLRLQITGVVPGLRDWRDLENLFLGCNEPVGGGKELPDTCGPDMWIFQPGAKSDPEYSKWATDWQFGERNGYDFEFTLAAIKHSERVSDYMVDRQVKQFFKQPVPPEWELPEWINEGDELSFAGTVALKKIFCSVPINCAQPIGWAQNAVRRDLALEEFGRISVHEKAGSGQYDRDEDLGHTGRVVVLEMPGPAGEVVV